MHWRFPCYVFHLVRACWRRAKAVSLENELKVHAQTFLIRLYTHKAAANIHGNICVSFSLYDTLLCCLVLSTKAQGFFDVYRLFTRMRLRSTLLTACLFGKTIWPFLHSHALNSSVNGPLEEFCSQTDAESGNFYGAGKWVLKWFQTSSIPRPNAVSLIGIVILSL